MNRLWLLSAPIIFLTLTVPTVQGQQITVVADAGNKVVLNRSDIEGLPHVKVTVNNTAEPANFEGVALQGVLEKAGISFGESLKGRRFATCLLVEASDGYRVVIALPEMDPAFTDKQILLVFLRNGKRLDEKEGPYRIVIPVEKRMARWVRQVKTLRIVDVQ